MSHVDEGALHAYLDGALDEYPAAEAQHVRDHLEVCEACRERLEVERAVRDEAASILGLAAPEVEVPTFEELRAYVRANPPRRSPVSVRLYRLGWAASLVLAVGTGWLLRGRQVVPGLPRAVTTEAARAPGAGASPDAVEMERAAEVASAPTTQQATSSGVASPAASPSAPVVERAAEAATRRQREQIASADVITSVPSEPAVAAPDDRAVAPDVVAELDSTGPEDLVAFAAPARAPDDARRSVAQVAEPSVQVTETLAVAAPVAPSVESVVDAVDAAPVAAGAAPPDDRRERSSASDAVVVSANRADPSATVLGRTADRVDERDEAPAAKTYATSVPGLEVLDVRARGTGVRYEGTVTLQLLESGDTLSVIYLPPEIPLESLEAPVPDMPEIAYRGDGGAIVLRAPLTEEELWDLLGRLLAER